MASVKSASLCWILLSVWFRSSASKEVKNITAKPDETVTLPCEATGITNISIVEWIRPDLNNAVVCLYRNKCETDKKLSLKGRVQLNKDWKNGNASLIVNNVTTNDAGRYACYVKQSETKRSKRASNVKGAELIQTINLKVQESGGDKDGGDKNGGDKNGYVGLTVGLSVVGVILVSVGVF